MGPKQICKPSPGFFLLLLFLHLMLLVVLLLLLLLRVSPSSPRPSLLLSLLLSLQLSRSCGREEGREDEEEEVLVSARHGFYCETPDALALVGSDGKGGKVGEKEAGKARLVYCAGCKAWGQASLT